MAADDVPHPRRAGPRSSPGRRRRRRPARRTVRAHLAAMACSVAGARAARPRRPARSGRAMSATKLALRAGARSTSRRPPARSRAGALEAPRRSSGGGARRTRALRRPAAVRRSTSTSGPDAAWSRHRPPPQGPRPARRPAPGRQLHAAPVRGQIDAETRVRAGSGPGSRRPRRSPRGPPGRMRRGLRVLPSDAADDRSPRRAGRSTPAASGPSRAGDAGRRRCRRNPHSCPCPAPCSAPRARARPPPLRVVPRGRHEQRADPGCDRGAALVGAALRLSWMSSKIRHFAARRRAHDRTSRRPRRRAASPCRPEWEPHAGCLMQWPSRRELWADRFGDAEADYAAVARAIAAFEPVVMVCNPGPAAAASATCAGPA